MAELYHFARLKTQLARSTIREFWSGSRLRVAVVTGAALVFWVLMFAMFLDVFAFLGRFPGVSEFLTDYLFAFFFLALLVMMTISNAIICYTSFYRNEEASFLMAMPIHVENTFLYKSVEGILFSAWGMGTLVVPMFLAYGLNAGAPWYYYPICLGLTVVFMGVPMELGAVLALVVPLLVPRRRKIVLGLGIICGLLSVTAWVVSMLGQRPTHLLTEAGLKQVVDRIAFCQHWALPSNWVSESMLKAARGMPGRAGFLLLFLFSNVLFFGMVVTRLGRMLFRRAWACAHAGARDERRINADNLLDRVVEKTLFPLPSRLRLLVVKDLRTFRRDPSQWSQCLLFFGLLALYIVNLPRFGFAGLEPFWHSLVSLLNLGATCLTLSTLTSRFVFPQLSLEGRRIWLIGLMPMKRSTVLWGKFFFATAGSVLISGSLIALSDVLLGLDAWVVGVHMIVVLCACCGLNGMAVGLGAVYPNMRSDNPSKIVSSFGGTLNLVCSICFILLTVILVALPLHLHAVRQIPADQFSRALITCLGADIFVAVVACLLPMRAGVRKFRAMEF